jgi:hypothetical protein
LDGEGVPSLDGDCNSGMNCVGEGVRRGKSEVVLACEAELVNELCGVLRDTSSGLHSEGNEVSTAKGISVLMGEKKSKFGPTHP